MNRITSTFHCLTTSKPFYSAVRFSSELFVSRLSFYTTNEQFKGMFSPFGDVKEARLIMDPRTGRTKGFGFVKFETEVEAQNAINGLNGRIVQGRLIFVEFANDRKIDGEDAALVTLSTIKPQLEVEILAQLPSRNSNFWSRFLGLLNLLG